MSALADRLRGIVGVNAGAGTAPAPVTGDGVAETLGGAWAESACGRVLVVDRSYGPGHRHGRVALMDTLPDSDGVWPRLPLLCAPAIPGRGRLLFIDLETTGLAGGAGTYAFLVGCAWFDGATLRVRQLFLSSFAAEAAMLRQVAALAAQAGAIVSFNGKSFDVPLIETRFVMHRMDPPFASMAHVDMLHPARRLWRADDDAEAGVAASCRLTALEETLCGMVREGDVPGFEIPSRYFHFVRTGDARPLQPVLEHNRLDLVSLAVLTARASQLLEDGPAAARTGREALGLGRIYERGALPHLAREAYVRAAEVARDSTLQAEALRAYAVLCRRDRRHAEAAAAWQRILDLRRPPPNIAREAVEALAVHHEHRLRDPHSARLFALQSLRLEARVSRQHAVRHRLARLERKLGPAADALRF